MWTVVLFFVYLDADLKDDWESTKTGKRLSFRKSQVRSIAKISHKPGFTTNWWEQKIGFGDIQAEGQWWYIGLYGETTSYIHVCCSLYLHRLSHASLRLLKGKSCMAPGCKSLGTSTVWHTGPCKTPNDYVLVSCKLPGSKCCCWVHYNYVIVYCDNLYIHNLSAVPVGI